jgi:predicted phosphoribosyltransferase
MGRRREQVLEEALVRFCDDAVLIIGIPTGGVSVELEVARQRKAEPDAAIPPALGAPDWPNLVQGKRWQAAQQKRTGDETGSRS